MERTDDSPAIYKHATSRKLKGWQTAEKGDTKLIDGDEYESVGTVRAKKDDPDKMESPDGMDAKDLEAGGKVGDRATDEAAPEGGTQRQYWRKRSVSS